MTESQHLKTLKPDAHPDGCNVGWGAGTPGGGVQTEEEGQVIFSDLSGRGVLDEGENREEKKGSDTQDPHPCPGERPGR